MWSHKLIALMNDKLSHWQALACRDALIICMLPSGPSEAQYVKRLARFSSACIDCSATIQIPIFSNPPRDGSERDRSIHVRHLRSPSESTRLEIWIKISKMHAAVCDSVSDNDYNNYRSQKPLHNSHTDQPLLNGDVSRAERID
jgi:hypothetical protein